MRELTIERFSRILTLYSHHDNVLGRRIRSICGCLPGITKRLELVNAIPLQRPEATTDFTAQARLIQRREHKDSLDSESAAIEYPHSATFHFAPTAGGVSARTRLRDVRG